MFRRTTCRLCGSEDVALVLSLAPSPPVDAFVERGRLGEPQPVFPLDLFACRACGHAQLLDVVSPDLLFGDYIYETGSSPGLVDHFRRYSEEVLDVADLEPGALVIDVGSNDGTLLRFFAERGFRVLGVDPAEEIACRAADSGIETVPAFLTPQMAARIRDEHGPAALVTANNVFAHADDMGGLADAIRGLLADDGLFVLEVSYLLDMIENMVFDFIYHEHLCHHSVKPLAAFLERHDLELVDVRHIPTKGGSLRGFAQPSGAGRPVQPSVGEFIEREDAAGLHGLEIYDDYAARIDEARRGVREIVDEIKDNGGTIAGYGASATGTVLMHYFELGDALDFIVDDTPERQGRFSPGHHVPVVAGSEIYERNPDYILILAWRFADMIMGKHERFAERGGRFVVPLPDPRVV